MWLVNQFPAAAVKKRYGVEVTGSFLDHVQLSSVRFNNGGSGSFVSPQGLLFTNHHVGRDAQTGETVDTYQPKPVMTSEPANGRFEARQGTIHLILGGGGTNTPTDVYGVNPTSGSPQAKVITKANRPFQGQVPEIFVKHGADALEDAIWSARRNTVTGYGIGVFDLDPGGANEPTTITMRYYHAPGADHAGTSDYQLFDTVVLAKERRDTKRG
jgi:hypothetical protein